MIGILQPLYGAADKPPKPRAWAQKNRKGRYFEQSFGDGAASHTPDEDDYTQLQDDGSSSSESEHGMQPTELESRVVALLRAAPKHGKEWGPRIDAQKKEWQAIDREAASQTKFTTNGQQCVLDVVDDMQVLVTALRWKGLSEIAGILEQSSSDSSSSAPSS